MKTTWENVNFEAAHTASASVSVADLSLQVSQVEAYQRPTRIVRMLINFELSAGSATGLTQQLGIGIWVVQHEALMGDGAADVLTDFQQDFYYWTTLFITPADGSLRTRQYGLIDIKTSRSIRGGYGLLFKS